MDTQYFQLNEIRYSPGGLSAKTDQVSEMSRTEVALVSEGTKVETKDDDYEVAEDADEESTRKSEKALMLMPLVLARERDRRKRIMNGF